jgi:hypothetical protein
LELITGLIEGDRYQVGFTQSFGAGQLTVVHLAPSPQLLLALHDMTGAQIPSRSLTPGITTALYSTGMDRFLFVINTASEDKAAEISIHTAFLPAGEYQVQDLITEKKWALALKQGDTVHVSIRRKDAALLKLAPVRKY